MTEIDDGGLAFPLLENLGMSKRDLVSALVAASIARNPYKADDCCDENPEMRARQVVSYAELVADEWIRRRAARTKGD